MPSRITPKGADRLLRDRLLVTACLAALAFLLVYLLAIHTASGQRFENSALAGARAHRAGSWYDEADRWLNRITAESFAVSLAVIAAVGIIRRRWLLALCGVLTAGGALAVSRVLKNALPARPDLAQNAYESHNTLPSGHATAAMALFFAMLIVVSRRWYLPVTVLGLPGAAGSGVATVAANWHRLSDTVAADLVVLAVGALCLAGMAHLGVVRPLGRLDVRVQRRLIATVSALALAALVVGVTYLAHYTTTESGPRQGHDAYWSAQALALAAALASAAVMLAIAADTESVPRISSLTRSGVAPRDEPGARDAAPPGVARIDVERYG